MVVFHTLGDVDDVRMAFVIEDVVFREIGMHKLALVEELADVKHKLGIQRSVDRLVFDLGVLQPG